ncbi:VPS9 domain-containing protein [Entamoeba marina]
MLNSSLRHSSMKKFLSYIKTIPSVDVKSLDLFIGWFQKNINANLNERNLIACSCYQTILFNLSKHPSPLPYYQHRQCVENYVFGSLHDYLFPVEEELVIDECLISKISMLNFVRPEHFNIPTHLITYPLWNSACSELQVINNVKLPIEKLECISKATHYIIYGNDHTLRMCCDDVLSVLTYVIIKAQPPLLYSNLNYIRNFAHEITPELDYYLTQFEIVTQIILNMDIGALKKLSNQYKEDTNKITNSPPLSGK